MRNQTKQRIYVVGGAGLVIFVGIWLVAIRATAPLIWTSLQEKPKVEATLVGYLNALKAQNLDGAFAYCGPSFRAASPYQSFVSQHKAFLEKEGKFLEFRLGSSEVSIKESKEDWVARYRVEMQFEKRKLNFLFELHHESGRWVLFGFRRMNGGA